ncbi:MAG: hypothetical protein J6L83_07070 [Clostridia bacterium]|nr:hypothetical protein [Clostridia bacterium]
MNKFEKDILESELGLKTLVLDEEENVSPDAEVEEEEEVSPDIPVLDEEAEQLKIDDSLLGSSDENNDFFPYGYQDELDLSSLSSSAEESAEVAGECERDEADSITRQSCL